MAKSTTGFTYRVVFSKGTTLRKRIDFILALGIDKYKGSSNYLPVEQMFEALVKGEPNPFVRINKKGERIQTHLEIIDPVFWAIDSAFIERDSHE